MRCIPDTNIMCGELDTEPSAIEHCDHKTIAERDSKVNSFIYRLVPVVLTFVATIALATSFVPYEILAHKARLLSDSGQASFFNTDFYQKVQFRLRVIAVANLFCVVVAWRCRKIAQTIEDQVRRDCLQLRADIKLAASSTSITDKLGLLVLVAIAAWLRFGLLFQPMRDDEAYTFLQYASRPFFVGLSFYNFPNNHLLNTVLVRCSYLVFGNSPWAIRLPVYMAGLLLVPATYIASRSLYRTESGFLAAGLTVCASSLIEYSTNARGYMLVCLVCLLVIGVAAHAYRNQNWASWLLFGALSAIGFFAVPIMLYPFGGILIWVVLCSFRTNRGHLRELIKGLSLAVGCCVITSLQLYTPVLAVSGPYALLRNKWVKAIPTTLFIHDLPLSFASTWTQWNWGLPRPLVWLLACGFFAALLLQRRLGLRHESVAIPVGIAVWVLPLLVVQKIVPFERVWLFALPVYFVVASAGIALILRHMWRHQVAVHTIIIAVVLVVGIQDLRSNSVYLSNEGRGLERLSVYLKRDLTQGDSVIAILSSEAPLRYYFQKYGIPLFYINSNSQSRVLLVVNQVAGDTVQSVITNAKRRDLNSSTAKLIGNFDSVKLYEIRVTGCPMA